jgi:hypothetical protein
VVCVNGDKRFSLQSVMKLIVGVAVMDAVDHGRWRLDEPVVVHRKDLSLYVLPIAKGNRWRRFTTIGDLVRRAIVDSDLVPRRTSWWRSWEVRKWCRTLWIGSPFPVFASTVMRSACRPRSPGWNGVRSLWTRRCWSGRWMPFPKPGCIVPEVSNRCARYCYGERGQIDDFIDKVVRITNRIGLFDTQHLAQYICH